MHEIGASDILSLVGGVMRFSPGPEIMVVTKEVFETIFCII